MRGLPVGYAEKTLLQISASKFVRIVALLASLTWAYLSIEGEWWAGRMKASKDTRILHHLVLDQVLYLPVTQEKADPPSRKAIADAKSQLAELYREDFKVAEATPPPKRFELLRSLAERSSKLLTTERDPATRYAIFEVSIDIGRRSGDIDFTCDLIDRFQENFSADVSDLRFQSFQTWADQVLVRHRDAAGRQSAYRELTERLEPFAKDAKENSQWELATKHNELLLKFATKASDKALRSKYERELKEVSRLAELNKRIALLINQLPSSTNAAADKLEIGKFYCLEMHDWKTGIQYLKESSDQQLALAAQLDATSDMSTWQNAGDVWWELAALEQYKELSTVMRIRAAEFYSLCIPSATGLALAKLEKRVQDVVSLQPAAKQKQAPLKQSESVELGLQWLEKQQRTDGSWSLVGPYSDGGANENVCAATAMAVLAFLWAGETQATGSYQDNVKKGVEYLKRKANAEGFFAEREPSRQRMYAQALATLAIVEAYRVTQDQELKSIAQRAVEFAQASQSKLGGWRYEPRVDSDTSVSGWFIEALTAAKRVGLNVDERVLTNADAYLATVASEKGARYAYKTTDPASLSMTASGLHSRLCLGWPKDNPALVNAIQADFLPNAATAGSDLFSVYYFYYATKVIATVGGDDWKKWRLGIHNATQMLQVKQGAEAGSIDPSNDQFGASGGRLYTTCLLLYSRQIVDRFEN